MEKILAEKEANEYWIYYFSTDKYTYDENKVGKWMYFFNRTKMDYVDAVCKEAIETGTIKSCKYTNFLSPERNDIATGVACFYLYIDDIEGHKKILNFFLTHKLIPKMKGGLLKNIPFKLDSQTKAGEYGPDFVAKLRLNNFINLKTGEWIADDNFSIPTDSS